MVNTPYGYRIENGRAVIDESQAKQVRDLFEGYISGLALTAAAEKTGLKLYHGSVGRILRNKKYLGDEYYPAIIDQKTFDKAEKKRMEKAMLLGRIHDLEEQSKPEHSMKFTIKKVDQKYTDPFKQAEYAYSLIESVV
ncbi:MAG: recombinase [Candidatus Metalachnospira sp.]|nr:recombinase [Candidatus Metalachnospira sp.]